LKPTPLRVTEVESVSLAPKAFALRIECTCCPFSREEDVRIRNPEKATDP
jgi:hypothetical protein